MSTEDSDETSKIPCPGLAAYRAAKGFRQHQLAAAIGKSRRHYQRFESEALAPESVLVEIAKVLDVDLETLTRKAPDGPDRELARLARRFSRDCERVRKDAGPKAYKRARERVTTAQPDLGRLLPE